MNEQTKPKLTQATAHAGLLAFGWRKDLAAEMKVQSARYTERGEEYDLLDAVSGVKSKLELIDGKWRHTFPKK